MQTRVLLGGLVVAGWCAWLVGQTPESPPRVEDLIEKLGSSTFAEREKAHKLLKTLDASALEALKKAAQTADLEVKRRLEEVIRRLEEKKLNQDVLAPKKVRLNVHDVTVNDAVNELAKLSGYPLQLQGDLLVAKEKKITLDTGEVTFWEALDQLCAKSGLTDVTNQQQAAAVNPRIPPNFKNPIRVRPLPAPIKKLPLVPKNIQPLPAPGVLPVVPPAQVQPIAPQLLPVAPPVQLQPVVPQLLPIAPLPVLPAPPQPQNDSSEGNNDAQEGAPAQPKAEPAPAQAPPVQAQPAQPIQVQVQVQQIQIGGFAGQVIGPNGVVSDALNTKITLKIDEKAKPAPTSYHGATRMRLLPVDKAKENGKDIAFTLDVAPEPRLEGFRIDGAPSIEKAIDDQGQSLSPAMDMENVDPNAGQGFNPMIMPIGLPWIPGSARHAVLRLQKGEKASKSLKELKGTFTAEVEIPNEKLMEVANILKASGEKTKTTTGGTVEIKSVKKQANGDYVVHLLRDAQNGNPFAGGGIAIGGGGRIVIRGGGGMVINGRNIGPAPDKDAPKLLDAKGNAYQVAGLDKSLVIENNNANEEMTITYRPNPGQQEPSSLVQFGSRAVKVTIPFTFRDVAIP